MLYLNAHQNGSDQPAIKVLSNMVFKMLVVQRKVSIVLDALDKSKTRDDVLLWIKDVVSRPELAHVQLFYTSRPESEFLRHIPLLIGRQICLPLDKQSVNSDIPSWVTAQLSQMHDFTKKTLVVGELDFSPSHDAGLPSCSFYCLRDSYCSLEDKLDTES
jgi:hypothetical protein